MRAYIRGILLFLAGLCVGAVATDSLHIWARPKLARTIRTAVSTEQEFLASKAAREGRLVESLIHRSNAASAYTGEGFPAIDRIFAGLEETRFLPFTLWAIHYSAERKYPNATPEGRQRVGALLWHKAELTLGELHLADHRFTREDRIADNPEQFAASSFSELLESENTEVYRSIEDHYSQSPGL